MTRRLLLVLALLAFAAPQLIPQTPQQNPAPAAQATGFGTIQGTVVREGTAEALTAVTDSGGKFSIRNVPAGVQNLRAHAGSLEGNVSGADQKPALRMTVVMIPQASRRQNAALYKTAQSDAQGHFTMTGLAPGQYTVYAWENVPFGAYQNAAFLSKYEERGTAVIIQAGARATVSLKSIPDDTSQR